MAATSSVVKQLAYTQNGMFRPQVRTSPFRRGEPIRTDGIENSGHKLLRFQHRNWIQ